MKKQRFFKIIFPILIFFYYQTAFSQGEISDENKILFRNERTYAFDLKSNGIGFDYRYAKRTEHFQRKWFYGAGIYTQKNPKEIKPFNTLALVGGRFVYGKTNSVFNIQADIGRQYELFTEFDKSSVSIRILFSAGPALAFMKPIYYKVNIISKIDSSNITEIKRFAYNIQSYQIQGRASFFRGINEIEISPGAFAKFTASFEYGKKYSKLRFLEAGAMFYVYSSKIKIMENENSGRIFPTVFLSYRFGKVISDYHLKENIE